MKVVITGVTGLAGGNVLKECIANSAVTQIIALSRRNLAPDVVASEKVSVLLHEDFSQWPTDVIENLKGAQACIWCVGGKNSKFPDVETARRVNYEFAKAFATACAETLVPAAGQQFTFVYCSGALTARDQNERLLFLQESRRIKGITEVALIDLEKQTPNFRVYIVRPGGILPPNRGVWNNLTVAALPTLMINVTDLATVMVDLALKGGQQQTYENTELLRYKRQLRDA